MKIAHGKITERTSGNRGYKSTWLYIPSKIAKDKLFPFQNQEEVIIELKANQLIVKKIFTLSELTMQYGIPDATLPHLIKSKAEMNGSKPFLILQNETFSYKKTNEIANQIANGILNLLKNSNSSSLNIGILFPNCPDAIFCWFGIAKTGNISVPISYTLDEDLLEFVLKNSDIKILFVDYQFFPTIERILKRLPELDKIIIRKAPSSFNFNKKCIDFRTIISENRENPNLTIYSSQPLELIYTAGTTGLPKGVLYRNHHTLSGISVVNRLKEIGFKDEGHKIYCPLPLFQAFARNLVIIPTMYYNNIVIISDKFNAQRFWNDVKIHQPSGFCYYGGYLSELMNEEPHKEDRKHSLKYAFGFGAFKKIWEAFERRFGVQIIEGWGLVESIGLTINELGSKGGKIGSIGNPARGYELKIVDSQGNELPHGRNNIGEIVSRPKLSINLEYYNIEADNQAIIGEDGWVYTGDYGYRDKDNFFYLLGRKKDLITKEGETFFTLDIERVANAHPLIINSAVFEVSTDTDFNKELTIHAEVKKEHNLSYQDFHSYLKENLAYFMVPRFIQFKEKLPKNDNGFVQKFRLINEWQDDNIKIKTFDTELNDVITLKQIRR
jgi:crotonobetaine/carnitine-CoA ligase